MRVKSKRMAAATRSIQLLPDAKLLGARATARGRRSAKAPSRRAAPFRCHLVIMAKLSEAGRVKSRLARQIGVGQATWFYRHTTSAVLGRLARSPRWQTYLAITPDRGVAHPIWPRDIMRMTQGSGNLGQRMQRAMRLKKPGPVIIIGTDVPGIRPAHIAAAFKALGSCDAVFGPATDGGYWLVGQRRRPRDLEMFGNVRWSTSDALADTLQNLRGYRIAFVATLSDVDTADDWRNVAAWCGRRILPAV